jgi:protease-4
MVGLLREFVRILSLLVVVIVGLLAASYLALAILTQQYYPSAGRGYVAVVKIDGGIAYRSSLLNALGSTVDPEDISRILKSVGDDSLAKAVVLLVNSPGGSAVASRDVFESVRKLSERKTVVVHIREYGTSGAYLISLPARYINAEPDSLVGSVGVVSVVVTFSNLLDRLGVRVYTFKSGILKDIGSPYRNITGSEIAVLQEIVNSTFLTFSSEVLNYRGGKIAANRLNEVFSGRPFTGRQAVEVGLIDGIGGFDDAVMKARELAGLPRDTPIRYVEPPKPGLIEIIYRILGLGGRRRTTLNLEVVAMWPLPVVFEEYMAVNS